MIALTQEKREELIEDCEKEILHTEKLLATGSLAIGWKKVHEKNLLRNQIALASLKAEPVAYTSELALVDVYIGDTAMMGKWNEVGDTPLFTAPPVPEIKLPDGYALVPIEPTEDMVIAGFESKPSAFNSSTEDLEKIEDMSGCEEAAHRAKLFWKAMVKSAPDVNGLGE